ncbi:MAG: phosphoglycerate kinase [bacterium]|nr:phosphoglycerate kinase [bacterium]
MQVRSIKQLKSLRGKTVLVRVDFNVPIEKSVVKESYKISQSLPTISYLLKKGAKVILVSHLGRPKSGYAATSSLKPLVAILTNLLKKEVIFLSDKNCGSGYWIKARKKIGASAPGSVILLENIRFFTGEAENSLVLSQAMASLADVFVFDGFAVAHRRIASVTGVSTLLPAYAGLLLEKEIVGLNRVLDHPKQPLVVILAGVKMETKIPVLKNLFKIADHILIGGGVFNTYLQALGRQLGQTRLDRGLLAEALKYCSNPKVIKPVDVVVGSADGKKARVIKVNNNLKINDTEGIFDIGPESVKLFSQYIKKARTIVWNGSMGNFEQHPYEYATYAIARMLGERSSGRAFGVCGGGETVEIIRHLRVADQIDLVSTGGGAMLKFLGGEVLPGIAAVQN